MAPTARTPVSPSRSSPRTGIRVRRGEPTPEELAAVTAVLLALATGPQPIAPPFPPARSLARWSRPAAGCAPSWQTA